MAYNDYLNKDPFAAGGVMQAPDRQTWIAQQKVAANALHLLSSKEWNRLAQRAFIEKQSFDQAMKQGQYDVQMGRSTPAAATFNRVMQERSGGQMGAIPQQVMPQPAQAAPAARTAGALIQGRYGGADVLVKPEAAGAGPGYGSISGMAPYGEGVNIQVGSQPTAVSTSAPAPQAIETLPQAPTPAPTPAAVAQTGLNSDVLDSVLKGAPSNRGMISVLGKPSAAPSILQQRTANQDKFKSDLMDILGVSKGLSAAPKADQETAPIAPPQAPAKAVNQPGTVANELLSYDSQLAQTAPAQPVQATAPIQQAQPQYAAQPAMQQQAAPMMEAQAPAQQAAPAPQAPAYRPFVAKPFSGSSAYEDQSVMETMAQHGQLQRYVAESNAARQAYTANVNAQSKAARDAVYLEVQKLNIGEKRAKAVSDQAKEQFAQTGGAYAQVKIGDKDFVAYQPSYGKFALKEIKKDKENPSLEFRQGYDSAGNPVPFFINTGDGKVHAVPPDALLMMQAMGGGGGGAVPVKTPAGAPAAAPKGGSKPSFGSVEEAQAANLPKGTKILIGGRSATVQ